MKTTTKQKFKSTASLFAIDQEGTLLDLGKGQYIAEEREVNTNFFMLYANTLNENCKIKELAFLFYCIKRMSNKNQIVFYKTENIAKKIGTCRQTIEGYIRHFKEENLIKYRPGIIMINPDFICRGTARTREKLAGLYFKFDKGEI